MSPTTAALPPPVPPERCAQCGTETSLSGIFQRQRRSFSRKTRLFCPPCLAKQRATGQRKKLWWWLLTTVSGTALVLLQPEFPLRWFFLNLAWFDVCLIASIAPHELAHALAARAVGLRVFRVLIGSGRTWWRGRVFGFRTEAKVFPFDGAVLAAPRAAAGYRWRRFLFILAGPVANAGLLVLAVAAVPRGVPWANAIGTRWAGWEFFALANALILLLNLWPRTVTTALGPSPSDGRNLWRAVFGKTESAAEAHALWFLLEAVECRESAARPAALAWLEKGLAAHPENCALIQIKSILLIEMGNLAAARPIVLALLARADTPPATRAMFLNNLAYVDALLGGEELLAEADRASAEALAAFPWFANTQGTRGTFLLAAGRLDEALAILRAIQSPPDEDYSSSAQRTCILALAEAAAGNITEAVRLRAVAHCHDPLCFLLPRVDAALRTPP